MASSKITEREGSRVKYVNVKIETVLNPEEILAAFLLWIDYSEDARKYRIDGLWFHQQWYELFALGDCFSME
jgi:hypothetical protein